MLLISRFSSLNITRLMLLYCFPFLLLLNYSTSFTNGCCYSHGFGTKLKPCCHNYIDIDNTSCPYRLYLGGLQQWYNISCNNLKYWHALTN